MILLSGNLCSLYETTHSLRSSVAPVPVICVAPPAPLALLALLASCPDAAPSSVV